MTVHENGLLEVADRIRRREVSSSDVTAELLDRIARYDGALHSTLIVLGDAAMEQARRADAEIAAGNWRGPLHGVPLGIKDLLWTRGIPTSGGMELLRDFLPDEDATVVTRLRDAGAVLIAKLHMTEAANFHHHPAFARPVNPWSAEHWTGASSSGSGVAVAAGFCFGSIGSDTSGSIRWPSAATSITGIKPTWGRVSRHGVLPLAESFDHIGPMARSAADAAAILQAIAGSDPRDPTSLLDPVPDYLAGVAAAGTALTGLTIGVDRSVGHPAVDPETLAAVDEASAVLETLGARILDVSLPWSAEDEDGALALTFAELGVAHEAYFPEHADQYSPWLREELEKMPERSAVEVARAAILRDRYRGRLRALFADVDLVLLPALPKPLPTWHAIEAIKTGDAPFDYGIIRFTVPFNFAGVPTISLPGGFGVTGLPIGIQLAGPWLAEPALIRAGVAFQSRTDHHRRRPDLDAL